MLKNYLTIALRNLRRHRAYSFINMAGLATGMASCLLILLYVRDELSYDRYHEKAERIVRLMALIYPQEGLHDAYVGLRASNPVIRANALEFLDNVLRPELRPLLVPLLDAQVTIDERIVIADRVVGAPVETAEQAIGTLLASEDSWLRSCAVYAVGTLQLHALSGELTRFEETGDDALRESVKAARRRLAGEAAVAPQEPAPPDLGMGVGAG